jgi:FkbM family methyltransferase
MNISHYCGDFTALTTTRHGDKIYVDTRDTSLAPHLLTEGDWEPWVTSAFASALRRYPTGPLIDVGANFGWYTLLGCRIGDRRVVAIEPHPRLYGLLQKTLDVNGYRRRVTTFQCAATQEPAALVLSYRDHELGGGTVEQTRGGAQTVSVRGETLDFMVMGNSDVTPACDARGAIIKIDVEGHEHEVLRGAGLLLGQKPILFLEHHGSLSEEYMLLLDKTHTIQEIRHTGHLGPVLDQEGLNAVGEAETLLCMPREVSGD